MTRLHFDIFCHDGERRATCGCLRARLTFPPLRLVLRSVTTAAVGEPNLRCSRLKLRRRTVRTSSADTLGLFSVKFPLSSAPRSARSVSEAEATFNAAAALQPTTSAYGGGGQRGSGNAPCV